MAEKTKKEDQQIAKEEERAAKSQSEKTAEKKNSKEKAPSQTEKLEKELNEEKEKYLRLVAEYDNFRKRSVKEKESIYPDAVAETVKAFLPMADNFERALAAESQDAEYKKGTEMTYKALLDVFAKLGVEAFGTKGDEFDPNLHNAVMHEEDDSENQNQISEVFQKGYKIGDRVLRFAMVKVIN